MTPEERAQAALQYHAEPIAGKIAIHITKPCATQADLALAYTPGVAEPVRMIAQDPEAVYRYTSKGNLVAVITNGTAVLGLGNVGALAAKPVMEGKAILFKKFADIDCFDIEVATCNTQDFIDTVVRIAPTFGGINLEDIAAPACFEIERALTQRLDIPVVHDDQHGTALIIAAGLLNALELQGKRLANVRIVCLGAGAAAIASMRLLRTLGVQPEQLMVVDRQGVIHGGRADLNVYKREFAVETAARSLHDALRGADVLIGLSGPRLVTPDAVADMSAKPVIFALSNPDPEIAPVQVRAVRQDAIIATGRSDYPNQVNNALGFPYLFRGALDVRARCINDAMLIAAAQALRMVAHEPVPTEVLKAYGLTELHYGPEYILPKLIDPRLNRIVSAAVAHAAVMSGVARMPYPSHYPDVEVWQGAPG